MHQNTIETLKRISQMFVDENFEALETLRIGDQPAMQDMKEEIRSYGRVLAPPPDEFFENLVWGEMEVGEAGDWIRLPFYTVEEGRSDLEIQLIVFHAPNPKDANMRKFEITNLLVA